MAVCIFDPTTGTVLEVVPGMVLIDDEEFTGDWDDLLSEDPDAQNLAIREGTPFHKFPHV